VADDPPGVDEEVTVTAGRATLAGHLTMPPDAAEIVVFAHGSASSRHRPRNRYVTRILHQAGLGTLLFDLLTPDEEIDRSNVFNIDLLACRLLDVIGWLPQQPATADLPVGLYGGRGCSSGTTVPACGVCEYGTARTRGPRPVLRRAHVGGGENSPTSCDVPGPPGDSRRRLVNRRWRR
jgi:putative phosphoribosyl transferase